jgi:hypothetical protein
LSNKAGRLIETNKKRFAAIISHRPGAQTPPYQLQKIKETTASFIPPPMNSWPLACLLSRDDESNARAFNFAYKLTNL